MNGLLKAVELIVALQRLLDFILDKIIERNRQEEAERLRLAILEARKARTTDETRAAREKITEILRGNYRPADAAAGNVQLRPPDEGNGT